MKNQNIKAIGVAALVILGTLLYGLHRWKRAHEGPPGIPGSFPEERQGKGVFR